MVLKGALRKTRNLQSGCYGFLGACLYETRVSYKKHFKDLQQGALMQAANSFFPYREAKHFIGDTLTCVKQWTRFRAACSYPKAGQLEAMSACMSHQDLFFLGHMGHNEKSKQSACFRATWYFFDMQELRTLL